VDIFAKVENYTTGKYEWPITATETTSFTVPTPQDVDIFSDTVAVATSEGPRAFVISTTEGFFGTEYTVTQQDVLENPAGGVGELSEDCH